ncbi:hypothetical protein Tco_0761362 [Tanacetum coccineum]
MDYLRTTKAELGIDLDRPLREQDLLETTMIWANNEKKHVDDILTFSELIKKPQVSVQFKIISYTSAPSSSSGKNKGLIAESYDWDEEEVSSDKNEVTEVKALMALAD